MTTTTQTTLTTEHDGTAYRAYLDGTEIRIYRLGATHEQVGRGTVSETGQIECDAHLPDEIYDAFERQIAAA